ncbi:MAG: HlyD family efflux transporter periplasmic adaptor subunit [Lachnospirales bacterium]
MENRNRPSNNRDRREPRNNNVSRGRENNRVRDNRSNSEQVQERRKKQPRRREKKIIEKTSFIVSLMIILAFLVWIATSVFRGMTSEQLATIDITLGSVSTPKEYDGLIVRDEVVYKATDTGELQYAVIEGDRVAKNGVVAYITDDTSEMYYSEAMSQLQNEDLTVKSLLENYNGNKEYILNLNASIKNKIDNRNYNTFSDFYALIDSVEYTVDLRNSYLLSGSENFDLTSYDENIEKSKISQYASESGIVSYNIDGYESKYTVDDFSNIVESDTKLEDTNTQNIFVTIESGQDAFKVVESNIWDVVIFLENEYIEENKLDVNKSKTIYVHNGYEYKELPSVITYIESVGDKSRVVFEISNGINDFLGIRNAKVKLENAVYSGYKIPASAIEHKDTITIKNDFIYTSENTEGEETYVYFSKLDGEVEKVLIDIHRESNTEGYSEILSQTTILEQGDILVQEDDNTIEYQIPKASQIDGVLVVNTGVAFFREVFIDETLSSGNSTVLLNVEDNTNIKQYDKIIEDATLAEEGDIIY